MKNPGFGRCAEKDAANSIHISGTSAGYQWSIGIPEKTNYHGKD
jgi:hypothetical protein